MVSFDAPGELKYLSLTIEARADSFFIHQREYISDLLEKWGLDKANGTGTMQIEATNDEEEAGEPEVGDVRLAQRMSGGLLWLSSRTRPDIAF
eukprot:3658811-Pyramimonas_sp.AAC.1